MHLVGYGVNVRGKVMFRYIGLLFPSIANVVLSIGVYTVCVPYCNYCVVVIKLCIHTKI